MKRKPTIWAEIWRGKTLGRALFNRQVARSADGLQGRVLDLAGGGSYLSFLPKDIELEITNLNPKLGTVIDFNQPLPYADQSFNHVLLFQALYIADEPLALMQEIKRVLKRDGTALVASPFLQNEMREPHDYVRFTSEGLERLFTQAGFSRVDLKPYGERFSVAANLLHSFLLFSIIRIPVYVLACLLDKLVPIRMRERYPAPIGWFCTLY